MNRLYVFVGFVLLMALAGYPFVQELRHVSDVKKSKADFQKLLEDRNQSASPIQRGSKAWESLPDELRTELRKLGFYPASPRTGAMGFTLRNFNDQPVDFREFSGKWLLINFWATWCPPCRMEMPSLDKFQDRFKDKLTVVTINVEQTRDTIQRFKKNYGFTLPVLLDSNGTVAQQYGATGLPETWLITPEGRPLAKLDGPLEWHKPPASTTFASLLSTRSN